MYAIEFHGFHSWPTICENKICEAFSLFYHVTVTSICKKISVNFRFWSHLQKFGAEKISHYTVYYSNYGTLTRNVWVYMYICTS